MPKPVTPPEEKLEHYDRLLATQSGVERKGKSMAYTSHNGNMYSYVSKEGTMAIRLPREDRDEFLEKYNTELDVQHGAVMKEYVRVPDNMTGDTEELKPYFASSVAYVRSLKPKPTKKKQS